MDRKRGSRSDSPQNKRQKVTHDTLRSPPLPADIHGAKKSAAGPCVENLATGLLDKENVERLRQEYADSEPFKYAKIETLFQDDLLRNVKDECLAHLSFTEKETDIYRVSAPVMRSRRPSERFTCVHSPDARPRRRNSRFLLFFLTSGPISMFCIRDFH